MIRPMLEDATLIFKKIIKESERFKIWNIQELLKEVNYFLTNRDRITKGQLSYIIRSQKNYLIYRNIGTLNSSITYIFVKRKR